MNYSDLQTEIAAYLHRGDLSAKIPTFIGLAEAFLFRELNVKELQTSTTLTTTGEYASLPADFGSLSKIEVTIAGKTYALDYQSDPQRYTDPDAYPHKFAFENGQIRVFGAGTGTSLTLYYVPKIKALSVSNTTNWLLDNAQDLYLFACCLEGARYIRAGDLVQSLTTMVSDKLEALKRYIERKGQPTNSSLQIKVRRG